MDTGAPLGVASAVALAASPFWPAAGLVAMGLALGIAAVAAARTVRGFV